MRKYLWHLRIFLEKRPHLKQYLQKIVDVESPSVANESVDALSDNYEQDIGDVYEERIHK